MAQMVVVDTDQVIKWLKTSDRKCLHIHHTWKPVGSQFNGSNHIAMNESMRNYHMKTNGWDDIAQHLTLFPDGKFCTGRPLHKTPISIKGWNTKNNPLAVEMVGNFDAPNGSVKDGGGKTLTAQYNSLGYDKLEGKQRASIVELVAYFLQNYGEDSIIFHRDNPTAGKTCPGSTVNKQELIAEARVLIKNGGSYMETVTKLLNRVAKLEEKVDKLEKKLEKLDAVISPTEAPSWAKESVDLLAALGELSDKTGSRDFFRATTIDVRLYKLLSDRIYALEKKSSK